MQPIRFDQAFKGVRLRNLDGPDHLKPRALRLATLADRQRGLHGLAAGVAGVEGFDIIVTQQLPEQLTGFFRATGDERGSLGIKQPVLLSLRGFARANGR